MDRNTTENNSRILMGIYSSSWGNSMVALTIVAVLEIAMLIYTKVNPGLYGEYIWTYRAFYISLLSVAVIYIALNLYVKKNIGRRHGILNVANPVCASFFFAWALGITYFDAVKYHVIDPTVFMTFSLTVPLSFYMLPSIYAALVIAASALMFYMTADVSGSIGPLINLFIFFIFQFVLGINFLRLKKKLAERIIEEKDNADVDVLTGFSNRRVYMEDMRRLTDGSMPEDLAYIVIDMNGLKDVNDRCGHEAGDRLIIGAARCIEQSFGHRGRMYRIGGDEFVVMLSADQEEAVRLLVDFDQNMKAWSKHNDMNLTAACGHVCRAECPDSGIREIARMADERMYAAKARYYRASGMDRRKYV